MKKIIKKISAISLAAIMALAMSSSAFADNLNSDSALQSALNDAGLDASQVKMLEVEMDDSGRSYEIEFIQTSNRTEFSYEIATNGTILEKSVDYVYKHNKSKKKIGKTKARNIVAKASGVSVKSIKKGSCTYKYKSKQGKYELKFRSGNYKYEYEILAPTGTIMEYEYEYIGTR